MTKTITIVILLFFSSCTTYLTTSKTEFKKELSDNKYEYLNGTYFNSISYYDDFWTTITDVKQSTDSLKDLQKEILEITALSSNLVKIKLYDNKSPIDSIFITGAFNDSTFAFRRKRNIGLLFPLFWTYDTDDFKIYLDNDKNLCLNRYGKSFVFVTIVPFMAADGSFNKKFKRQK